MKTKQIIKKATCFMISALLLSTSLPMQVLAQSTPTDEWLNFVNDPREKWIAEKYASENNKYY